ILVRTDASRRETEADEGNNLTVGPTVTVSLPNLPDLRVTALGPPEPYCYYVPPPPPIIASSRPAGATTEAAAARTFGGGYYVPCPPAAERDTGTLYRSGGPLGGGGVDVTNIRYAYTWTGVNEGDGPARGGFEDALYFQETPDFNTFEATFLGVVQVDSTVNPGETYTTATPVLGVHDQVLPDSGYYFIRANWQQQAFEGAASDNNLYRSPGRTILRDLPPSDVAVEGLSAPASVTARDSLNVTFTIRNLGPSAVAQALVSYAVYLSEDDELTTEGEEADRLIGRSAFDNVTDGPLQPDGFETFTARLLAPDGEVGARTLFVVLDREGLINERIGGTLFTDNNVAQTTITLGPPALPDLTPADLTVPATATAGDPVLVRYEVRNTGAALRPPARRADQLYVSDQDVWPGREAARRLLYQDEREPLAAGDAYQRDLTPRLPRDLEAGVQYVYLVADADSTQPEADEANNVRRSSAITVAARPRPDLAVTFQTGPPTSAMSGETVRLGWRVENTGTRATSATSWTDAVLLSTDDEPSADDTVLGREVRIGALVPGASYTATLDVPLPADRDGTFTLLVVTDRGGDVDDASRENNNAAPAAPTAVTLTAPADLRVAQFTLTGTPQAGQPLRGVVEVVNDGAAIPAGTAWTDAWTLSPGTERGPGTATLLTEAVQGPLASGARYTHTVDLFLPDYASGSYLLAVTADSRARVTEGGQRENNTREERVEIELPPPVDLVVENVAVPADATPGQETTITYDLVNRGQSTLEGLFFDAVHLSEDATFEIEDPRLAFERRSLSLPPGVRRALAMTVRLPEPGEAIHVQNAGAPAAGSSRLGTEAEGIPDGSPALGEAPNALRTLTQVDQEAAGTVPNLTPGDYRAIVWTDVRGGVRETDNDNNRTASDGQIGVAIPALTLGQPEPVVLAAGIERYYRLDVPEGRDLRLSLGNPTTFRDEEFELFVAYDRVPTPGDFDAAFAAESALGAPELLVPSTRAGTYYVLVRNPYLLARFGDEADVTLTAEAFDFRLFSSTPDAGGTQGRVLATVRGAQLAPGTTFHLEGGGARVDGRVVRVVSSMEAQVEFDLQGAATGRYDIVAERASMTARLADGFEVQTPSAVRLREALVRPPALRFNERAALEAVVTNDGNVDLDVVVMSVLVPAEVMFSLTSEDFVGSILSPDAAPDPSATVQRGITIDVVLPDGDVLQMGLITVIARDLRIGESFTADLVSPQVTLLPGELAPFAITTRGYTREEFAAMIQENAPRILGEIDRSPDLLSGTPEIAALLATNNADAVAQIASNLDAFFASVGLTGDGPLRGSRTVTYTPQAGAPAALRVDLASLLATPQECADLGTAFGIGIGIPALIVGIILLPAELTALAVIGVIAGAISLAVALDSVINNRDWGLLGEFGLPASPLDLVPLAIRFACDPTLGSVDPNDILGPEGYGAARWIPRDTPIPYTIRFENDATLANAPAKEVIITQTLDEDLDLRSFRVERFGFGERSYKLPGSGRAYYTDRLDLRDSLGVFVDVATTLDVTSGEIRLSLRAIDPQTGALTQDPLGGFLPPNEDAPEGEGFFAYRIRPLETAPEAARIDAQASIVFDSNPPIETPPIFNTLDAAAPESRVDGGRVVVLDTSSVQLSWNSSDRGAGLASVALYARRADTGEAAAPPFVGASFEPIATGLTDSTFVFEGAPGAQYEFFTLATDFAGNTEPMKTTPDVAVVVSGENGPSQTAAETLLLQGYPNPTRGRVTIPFQVAGPGEAEIEVYDLLGRRVLWLEPEPVAEGRHTREVNLRGFAAGVYLYQLRVRDERGDVRFADTRRITVVR
ncbi:MAG: CARDB domain-containing protein, partial [Bacteroidota bacterium]